jgi:hypothetical protein
MTPYDIQQRVLHYLEDPDMVAVVRRFINEAIQRLCASHEAGKDYSFLRTTATIDCASAFTNNTADLPARCRAVVDLTYNGVSPADGFGVAGNRTITKPSGTTSGNLTVDYYQQHETLTITGTWTSDGNTPNESILVPEEFHPLIVWMALDLCYEHEIEIAAQRVAIAKRIQEGIAALRASYSQQIYPLAQAMTVRWLAMLGSYYAGSERNRAYMIHYINTIAAEVCDKLKIQYANRPNTVSNYSETLPQILGTDIPANLWQKGMFFHVAEKSKPEDLELRIREYEGAADNFRRVYYDQQIQQVISAGTFANRAQILIDSTNEMIDDISNALRLQASERPAYVTSAGTAMPVFSGTTVPRDVWRSGYYYKLAKLFGEQDLKTPGEEYGVALRNFANSFYARDVSSSPVELATYGDLVSLLRETAQSHLNDAQIWKIVNRAVSDFLSRIDVEDLMTHTTITTVSGTQSYSLPATLKKIYRVIYDGEDIVGWSFDNRWEPDQTNQGYQNYGDSNYFSFVGRNLILRENPESAITITVWYYVKAGWETDTTATLPVDGHYLVPYCEAHIALLQKDFATHKMHKDEYLSGVQSFDENQMRNLPQEERFRSAYPSTGNILDIITGSS